jgi:hypothetical protein
MSVPYITKVKNIHLGAIAIDSDALLYALWKVDHAIKVTAVRLGVNTSCAAADTNYNTFYVKNGTVVISTIANGPVAGGTSFVLGTMSACVVTTAAGANLVAAGDTLSFKVTKTGNGLALAGACLQIEYLEYQA